MRISIAMVITLATLAASGSGANAGFVATVGVSVLDPAPADVDEGEHESNTVIFAFAERRNLTLSNDVIVDFTATGSYDSPADLPTDGTAKILAGTRVDSYFLHADKDEAMTGTVGFNATVTFSTDIIGVIMRQGNRNLTDSDGPLGAPGTDYPGADGRGLELGAATNPDNDQVTLSADRRTLTVHFAVAGVVDEVRVITAESFDPPTAVPEPASLTLGMTGILAAVSWSRRKRRQTQEAD